MASLLNKDDDEQTQAAPTTTTSGGAGSAAGTSVNGAPSGNPTQPAASPQADSQKSVALNQNLDFSPLMSYVSGQGTNAKNAINTANTNFTNTLGTTPTFGQDQQNTLSSVLSGGQPLSVGQSLLNTTYTPTPIDNASYDPLVSLYQQSANQTGNQAGISTLLGSLNPGLSPGERSYDAMTYQQNPNYQSQSNNIIADANNVANLAGNTTTNAGTATGQRGTDVNTFNQAGNSYIQRQRDSINNALNAQISQANAHDSNLQNELGYFNQGRLSNLSDVSPSDFNFDPNAYKPTNFVSEHGADVFNQTVNPAQYLSYNPGQLATRDDVATGDQMTQYNNAESLLNAYDKLTGGTRQAASLGLNNVALQQALANAQSQMNAANAAWDAAHQPAPAVAAPAAPYVNDQYYGAQGGEGGGEGGADGGGMGGNSDAGPGDAGGSDQGGPGGADSNSGGDSGDAGGDSFHKGGLVGKARKPRNLKAGGYIPTNAGPPGVDTLHGISLNNGEFVTQAPAVSVIGPSNLAKLNQISALPTSKEAMVRKALHSALSRAALGTR